MLNSGLCVIIQCAGQTFKFHLKINRQHKAQEKRLKIYQVLYGGNDDVTNLTMKIFLINVLARFFLLLVNIVGSLKDFFFKLTFFMILDINST
jgi:hypothetical protein